MVLIITCRKIIKWCKHVIKQNICLSSVFVLCFSIVSKHFREFSVIFGHSVSFSAILGHCQSLSIIISHHQSSSITISHYQSLSVIVSHCQSFSVIVNHCQSLSAIISHYQSLSVIINHYQSLSVIISHHQSLSVIINHCQSLSYDFIWFLLICYGFDNGYNEIFDVQLYNKSHIGRGFAPPNPPWIFLGGSAPKPPCWLYGEFGIYGWLRCLAWLPCLCEKNWNVKNPDLGSMDNLVSMDIVVSMDDVGVWCSFRVCVQFFWNAKSPDLGSWQAGKSVLVFPAFPVSQVICQVNFISI